MAEPSKLLDAAVEALQEAHRAQRYGNAPSHVDFYGWGWGLSEIAAQLAAVAVLLEHQVGAYPDRWELRDDAGMDPQARIDRCTGLLAELAGALGTAGRIARTYHGEMSHIAIDDDRWNEEE